MEIPSTLCSNVYDFAFCPEPCYDRLADLADPEDWGRLDGAVWSTSRSVKNTARLNENDK